LILFFTVKLSAVIERLLLYDADCIIMCLFGLSHRWTGFWTGSVDWIAGLDYPNCQ